ncbi:MAG TPA: circadian clock KaiB family protein [Pirellulales bacterium]
MDQHAFTLYIAGGSELADRAVANFKRFVATRLNGAYDLTIIDVIKEPRRARQARVVATPLLVRHSPAPLVKILGDLSEEAKVLTQLGLTLLPDASQDGDPLRRS